MRARTIAGALAATLWVAAAQPAHAQESPVPVPPHVELWRQVCGGYAPGQVDGCAYDDHIEVRPGAGPAVYWHEVGHLFDYHVMTDQARQAFQLLTRQWGPWWGTAEQTLPNGDVNPAYHPPGERFAGAYSMCAMQHTGRLLYGVANDLIYTDDGRMLPTGVEGDYGYHATWRRHQRICALIWHTAGRHYTPSPTARWRNR